MVELPDVFQADKQYSRIKQQINNLLEIMSVFPNEK